MKHTIRMGATAADSLHAMPAAHAPMAAARHRRGLADSVSRSAAYTAASTNSPAIDSVR
jgi:hypothetical protein